MPPTFVLDTSALLAGRPLALGGPSLVPPEVLAEVQKPGRAARNVEYLLAAGLTVCAASAQGLAKARAAAQATGDGPRLSPADLAVLGLALDHGATIVTDDYRIQNVARRLALATEGRAQSGIQEAWVWVYRCVGCGRVTPEDPRECRVCGSATKPVRARPGQKP